MRTQIERIPGFPDGLARAVLHIVLSHHGLLENGSPVVPCTREATVVHAIDNLGGKLGSFDRLEKGLQDGGVVVALRPRDLRIGLVRAGRAVRRAARTDAPRGLRRIARLPGAGLRRSSDARSGPMEGTGEVRPFLTHVERERPQARDLHGRFAGRGLRTPRRHLVPASDGRTAVADWLIAVILAFSASVVLIGTRRLLESRAQIAELARRTSGLADAAWIVTRGGETASLLGRVAEQACGVLHVERATVCVRDQDDPRLAIVVAGHGVRDELTGKRLGVDEGIVGQVLLTGEPVIVSDYHDFPENSEPGHAETRAGGSAPIKYGGEVRGAISVGTTDPLRAFGRASSTRCGAWPTSARWRWSRRRCASTWSWPSAPASRR